MRLAFAAFGFLALAPAAAAQESACVTIGDDAERLACYDAANGRTARADDTPLAESQARERRLPNLTGLFGRDEADSASPPMPYQVASRRRLLSGQTMLIMANREVWVVAGTPERLPEPGENVVIRSGLPGEFVLTPQSGAPFRVRRQ